jgi:hypothetical protein
MPPGKVSRELADQQVAVLVLSPSGPVELKNLDPDQLLGLQATENPTT